MISYIWAILKCTFRHPFTTSYLVKKNGLWIDVTNYKGDDK